MFDDKREQVNEKQKKVTQQWLLPAACCARGKKPLFEFETPLLDGVIEEYFANGALERRRVAVREGADGPREGHRLAQPLTERSVRRNQSRRTTSRRGGRAHPGRRGAAQLVSAPQRMLMLSK